MDVDHNLSAYSSQVSGTMDTHHHTWLIYWNDILLTFCPGCPWSSILLISTSQVARIIGVSHCTWPLSFVSVSTTTFEVRPGSSIVYLWNVLLWSPAWVREESRLKAALKEHRHCAFPRVSRKWMCCLISPFEHWVANFTGNLSSWSVVDAVVNNQIL
jgi:hypothetical protein